MNGVEVQATLIEVSEPRAVSKVYLSAKGDLIKIEGPMGMLMIPATREEALAASEGGEFRDLASLSRIVPDKPIPNPSELRRLRLRISGVDLSRAPGDDHQSLKEEDSSWTVETHPWPFPLESEATISSAAQFAQKWVRPSMLIPSDDPNLGKLASGIIGQDSRLSSATLSVVRWVNREMSPNAGIGVLRDARKSLRRRRSLPRLRHPHSRAPAGNRDSDTVGQRARVPRRCILLPRMVRGLRRQAVVRSRCHEAHTPSLAGTYQVEPGLCRRCLLVHVFGRCEN